MDPKPPSLRSGLRAIPAPVWILYGGSFLNRFGTFVIPFLVLYLTRRGFSAAEAGAALGAFGLGSMAAAALGGLLADRIGRRRTIALSMFSSAATMLALSQARSLWMIALLVGLAGLASDLYRPASAALMMDLVPPHARLAAFATYRLAVNAGFAFGPAVGGALAGRSFFWLFVGDALSSAAYGIVALVALPEGHRTPRGTERRGAGMRAILADRTYLRFLVALGLTSFVFFQSESTFALHVRDAGISAAMYGLLLSMNGALIVLVELPLTSWTQRLPAKRVIAGGILLVGVGFALTAIAHSVPLLAMTVLIWTFGEIAHAPVAWAYVAEIAPAAMRGRYQGAMTFTFSLGFVASPSVGALVYGISPAALWLGCGLVAALAAGLVLRGPERHVMPDIAHPEAGPELPGAET